MEDLYLKIGQRTQRMLPELTCVDEDYGQLQSLDGQDSYPVTFPCALIDTGQIDWRPDKDGCIRGRGVVIIRLAFDCYEDTHLSAKTNVELQHRVDTLLRLWSAMNQYCFGENYSPLQLTQSRTYTVYGMKKVYESTFSINIAQKLSPAE